LKSNNYELLDMMHHLTAGLKSVYANMAYEGIDACRMSCGGAGYSSHSFLPDAFFGYSPVPTYEGDTTVMAKQSLSFIEKTLKQVKKGKKITGPLAYLSEIDQLVTAKSTACTVTDFSDLEHLDRALAVRAGH
jgi:acyl-CoA oxidase